MRFSRALLVATVLVAGCGAPAEPGTIVLTPTTGTASTSGDPGATTTEATPGTVPTQANDPTSTVLPESLPPAPTTSATDPPRITAAPGPPFQDASCRGDIVGTFTYVDGSTAAVRTGPTDFCVADGSAGMNVPYLPPSASPTPYIGVAGDGWLGSFAVVALPEGFPSAFTVWRDDGTPVPAVLGVDGRSLLVRVNDSTVPSGHGELTFKTPDGAIVAVTGPP